ncbi:acyltransferase family protein [Sphingobacterium corticibacter]|uniref:Acyltransferase 3 domain-containing protein n=1 Tax=Sphingobacterium corticibacter TaxID=2171749 RepID=A0A2T8HH29_9SPHI|nr:acyltransferase family protein [Sphingobacterium corticibacter]PVH24746.1 hypothetical protein DC487_11510 [Sphingobacterium corticibacter]
MNDVRFSRVIDGMRFPLIYLVVVAHLIPFTVQEVTFPATGNELYVLISELFSHHISKISVRCFFFVSGYFFFQKCTSNLFQFAVLQWRSRFSMLLIPFFVWNIITILVIAVKNVLFEFVGLARDVEYVHVSKSTILQLLWTNPINFPLWYVRDLLCMIALFPFLFYYIKISRHFGILALGAIYLMNFESTIPGLSTTAIFFFSAGAYFSIHKKDLLHVFHGVKVIALLLAIAFLVLAVLANGEPNHEYFLRVFLITGVVSSINLFAYLEERNMLPSNMLGLSSLTFFIYVAHEIYIINFLKGFFYDLEIYENGWIKIVCYIIIPLLCIGICMVFFYVFQKCVPRIVDVILGRRPKKQSHIPEQVDEKLATNVA